MASSLAINSAGTAPSSDALLGSSTGLSPEERMLALIVYSQASQMAEAKTTINMNAEQLEKLREQVKEALDKAREAKHHSGFWGSLSKLFSGDIASIASAVAAVAAVIATGGAAAAVLAVVAVAASFAAEHAKELGIPPGVAMAIAIGASAAALCCGNAKGLLDLGKVVQDTAKTVKLVATVTQGTAMAAGGGCHMVEGKFERDAGYLEADARSAQGQQRIVSSDIDEALDWFSEAVDHQNKATRLTSDIQLQSSSSNDAILNNWGAVA